MCVHYTTPSSFSQSLSRNSSHLSTPSYCYPSHTRSLLLDTHTHMRTHTFAHTHAHTSIIQVWCQLWRQISVWSQILITLIRLVCFRHTHSSCACREISVDWHGEEGCMCDQSLSFYIYSIRGLWVLTRRKQVWFQRNWGMDEGEKIICRLCRKSIWGNWMFLQRCTATSRGSKELSFFLFFFFCSNMGTNNTSLSPHHPLFNCLTVRSWST